MNNFKKKEKEKPHFKYVTIDEEDKVLLKFYSTTSDSYRTHKFNSYLEKYPKGIKKNIKVASEIVDFLNFIQDKTNQGLHRGVEFITIEDGAKYLEATKKNVSKIDLNLKKALLTKFLNYLARNEYLKLLNRKSIKKDTERGGKALEIPF